ncbi:MAG TPA: glycerol-3-phosphate 1-O-acyltransferase PlsY [Candidatus Binatia bacterium]|nr:glycerol-3-phosphate 1-O-acyltransferase PlsY [Candidatus Binatia bacterium]
MTRLVLIIVVVSYLLGSIPFGYLLVRIFRGQDIRKSGSGNIGATNVARGSKGLGLVTLLLDAFKGYAAVAFALWLAERQRFAGEVPASLYGTGEQGMSSHTILFLAALAAFVAIVGHIFTIWLRFRGGKGVAAAAGAFLGLAPRAMLVALVLFVLVVALTRYVSLGSIIAVAAFPLCFWWLNPAERTTPPILLLVAASSLLIVVRHRDNIRRLLAGTENRLRQEEHS